MTATNLNGVELVHGFIGVEVFGLDVQNDEGTFVLVDESQWGLEVARGSEQGCGELLRAIKEMEVKQVILSEYDGGILLEAAEDVFVAAGGGK